jgi:ParB family transcriptional regulator, chromosome partitioning protein
MTTTQPWHPPKKISNPLPLPVTFYHTPHPMAKQALGKGLGALIKKNQSIPSQSSSDAIDDSPRVREIAIENVVPSPLQPRNQFIDAPLDDLMDSIRQHGIIQPLIARLVDGKYELIAGERRWRASKKLGLTHVPVIERTASDRDVLEMALIENLQREDLNPIEEAAGYVRLAKEFNLKQEEIATRVGKSRASVANAMRLLDLHTDIQNFLAQGQITVGHAKAILALKNADTQKLAADQIIRRKLTVRAAEKLTQSLLSNPVADSDPKKSPHKEVDIHIRVLSKRLQEHLATHVAIIHSSKKGKIEIEYYGNDDLDRILDLIKLPKSTL